jgi:hypothetical protein
MSRESYVNSSLVQHIEATSGWQIEKLGVIGNRNPLRRESHVNNNAMESIIYVCPARENGLFIVIFIYDNLTGVNLGR